ncbi:MAG: tryptophan 2,3-dioxygenase [Bacteroidia bacterium]|nr:tryptophan 2,3-dioxygenase [Bacteroidia bacterium]
MEMNDDIKDLVSKLTEKYDNTGQDVKAYLEGLLESDFVPYWNYINLDTLLTLQKPKTKYPDELIFIIYHQISELYFRLMLNECEQITDKQDISAEEMLMRLVRINRYFSIITDSFDVMQVGMEQEQFLKFRMALLPASGFQSAAYRKIEFYSTSLKNIVGKDFRQNFNEESSINDMYPFLYWKAGATEIGTGIKTFTLRQFEEHYDDEFIALAEKLKGKTIQDIFNARFKENESIIKMLKKLDQNVNVNFPLQHYKTAVKYLQRNPDDIPATGGTNWQKYLPPRFQKRIFYADLWTEQEIEEWGKAWVEEARKNF